jgi:hypothetical protein
MSLLGFRDRFVPNVLAGYYERVGEKWGTATPKRHSIRALRKDGRVGHTVGKPIQLYARVRQKDAHKIVAVDPVCTKIEPIIISTETDGRSRVLIDHDKGYWNDEAPWAILSLARADGFPDVAAFFDFLVPTPGDHFRGNIIHWDWL